MKKVLVVVLVTVPVIVSDEGMGDIQIKQCAVAGLNRDGYTHTEALSVEPWKHKTILEVWHPPFPSLVN